MELFVVISFIGTLVLMAVHLIDYALESKWRPRQVPQVRVPDEEVPSGDVPAPFECDRAA